MVKLARWPAGRPPAQHAGDPRDHSRNPAAARALSAQSLAQSLTQCRSRTPEAWGCLSTSPRLQQRWTTAEVGLVGFCLFYGLEQLVSLDASASHHAARPVAPGQIPQDLPQSASTNAQEQPPCHAADTGLTANGIPERAMLYENPEVIFCSAHADG